MDRGGACLSPVKPLHLNVHECYGHYDPVGRSMQAYRKEGGWMDREGEGEPNHKTCYISLYICSSLPGPGSIYFPYLIGGSCGRLTSLDLVTNNPSPRHHRGQNERTKHARAHTHTHTHTRTHTHTQFVLSLYIIYYHSSGNRIVNEQQFFF